MTVSRIILVVIIAFVFVAAGQAAGTLRVVPVPPTTTTNDFYVGNAKPLTPSPLIKLPIGAVKADGWLRRQLELQIATEVTNAALMVDANRERLQAALSSLYAWYERNAALTACVLRDAEHHALTKEIVDLRMGAVMAAYHEVLGEALTGKQRKLLPLALSFFTWRSLTRDGGLDSAAAAEAMSQAIMGAL